MTTTEELACVYSALILQDDSSPVTTEKLQALLKSAGVQVEPYWPGLFAKALETLIIEDLVSNVGPGNGSAVAPQDGGLTPSATEKREEQKEEKKEEEEDEDDDMGFGLFE